MVRSNPARNNAPARGIDSDDPAQLSRFAALNILNAVIDRHRPLDEAVEAALAGSNMEARDRGFARLLGTTAIRRLGQIDDALSRLIDTKLPLKPPALMNLLRIGAVQLLFLGTKPHAAVGTSVDLAQSAGLERGKGLVNAVLRRLSREGEEILASQDAERLAVPDWLWARWTKAYGVETTRAFVAQHLAEPPLDLTLRPGKDPAYWAEQLGAIVLPTGALRRPVGGRIEDLPGFAEGAWWIQDAAASIPVSLFGDVTGKTAYDLCAAPGGKTVQLAAAGARVTAVDRSTQRLEFVRDNLRRLGLSAATASADGLAWTPPDGPADLVLLDAPCTATGTIRRHPDIAIGRRPEDLAQLTRLQAGLLARAVDHVKPGGTLIYCTCSLEPEEGERQIARLLADRKDFARRPVTPDELPGLPQAVTAEGDVRTLPHYLADQGGIDGFYIARLTRTG